MQKRIAIVGFGEMGKRHGKDFIELSRGEIKLQAVVEPDDACYERGCEFTGCRPARYDSVKDMLTHEKPDGVIISSPNFCHLDNLREMESSGIPVLLEKPLESTFDKICEIVRFSRRYSAPIMVHHVMRYSPIVEKARELVETGALGRVCSAHFTQTINGAGGLFHNFRRNMKTGGGQLIEKATHDLDVMLFLMEKKPVRVSTLSFQQAYGGDKSDTLRCKDCDDRQTCRDYTAKGAASHAGLRDIAAADDLCVYARAVDVPDNETCIIEMDGNSYGVYSHCFFMRGYTSREYQVIGTEASMRIIFSQIDGPSDGRIIFTPRFEGTQGRVQEFRFAYNGRIHYNGAPGVVRHFTEVMDGTAQPRTTVEDAFMAELIGCAAYRTPGGEWSGISDLIPEDLRPR